MEFTEAVASTEKAKGVNGNGVGNLGKGKTPIPIVLAERVDMAKIETAADGKLPEEEGAPDSADAPVSSANAEGGNAKDVVKLSALPWVSDDCTQVRVS